MSRDSRVPEHLGTKRIVDRMSPFGRAMGPRRLREVETVRGGENNPHDRKGGVLLFIRSTFGEKPCFEIVFTHGLHPVDATPTANTKELRLCSHHSGRRSIETRTAENRRSLMHRRLERSTLKRSALVGTINEIKTPPERVTQPPTPTSMNTRGNPLRNVNWLFFNPANADSTVWNVTIPGHALDTSVGNLEWVANLKDNFKFRTNVANIKFWTVSR